MGVSGATSRIDQAYFEILSNIAAEVITEANNAAASVLTVSSEYLSESAKKALDDFNKLYFGGEEIEASSAAVNKEVDDIFEQAKNQWENDATAQVVEKDESKQDRLSISGLQKRLETIISLDKGIKAKLLPVLTSMQFEDLIKHRLEHIQTAWRIALENLDGATDLSRKTVGSQIAEILSSNSETRDFYDMVLHEPAPEGLQDDYVWFDDIA